jgi:small subunit ribosomal protein S18
MAEKKKNEEKEAPELESTEAETAAEAEAEVEPEAVEDIASSEEASEEVVEAETAAEAKAEVEVDVESEPSAQASIDTSEKDKSEAAAVDRSPNTRRPGGPQGRGRGRPNYQNQGGRSRRGYFRRKVCRLCVGKINSVDYKDVDMLRKFVTERGKIMPRRMTGTCAKHQRIIAAAVKRARMVALLPYVSK